jgi:hypothetical protein
MITPTEHSEAVALAAWMRLRNIFFFHCPSEGKRSYALASYLRAEGMVPGVPDYAILSHPAHPSDAEFDGITPPIFLELKRLGGKLSPSQEGFLAHLQREGYQTIVAYGATDAIDQLMKMGY